MTSNANYTMEVRHLWSSSSELFDFDYNFYVDDEEKKTAFEKKFYDHYYFDEIGFETPDRFKHRLKTMLNEVQPRYSHLYETTQYEYDPLENYNVDETITTSGVASSTGLGEGVNYDTPIQPKENYQKTPSFINETETTTQNDSETTSERQTKGNIGVQTSQDLIQKERAIIVNIDEDLIKELEQLFMSIL